MKFDYSTITILDGAVVRPGDACWALASLKRAGARRWMSCTIEEILQGGGVDRARVKLTKHGVEKIIGRYRLSMRKP